MKIKENAVFQKICSWIVFSLLETLFNTLFYFFRESENIEEIWISYNKMHLRQLFCFYEQKGEQIAKNKTTQKSKKTTLSENA